MTQNWVETEDVQAKDRAAALADALSVAQKTPVEGAVDLRAQAEREYWDAIHRPSAGTAARDVNTGRREQTTGVSPEDQNRIKRDADVKEMAANAIAGIESRKAPIHAEAERRGYVANEQAVADIEALKNNGDPRMAAVYARLNALTDPSRRQDGPLAGLAAGAGSLAKAWGGTDTFQAERDRAQRDDMQNAAALLQQAHMAEKMAAQHSGTVEQLRLLRLAAKDALQAAGYANIEGEPAIRIPGENAPRLWSPESGATIAREGAPLSRGYGVGVPDPADSKFLQAQAAHASQAPQAGAAGPYEGPRAPVGTQQRAVQNAMSWEDAKTKLGQIWNPSAPPTPDGTLEALGIGRPITSAPEPVAAAPAAPEPRVPVTSLYPTNEGVPRTAQAQANYYKAVGEALAKGADQAAAFEKAGGHVVTQDSKHMPGSAGHGKNATPEELRRFTETTTPDLHIASSERNVDAANNSREQVAISRARSRANGNLPPGEVAEKETVKVGSDDNATRIHIANPEDRKFAARIVADIDAMVEGIQEIRDMSKTAVDRGLNENKIVAAQKYVRERATGVSTTFAHSNRAAEPVMVNAAGAAGTIAADDIFRRPDALGADSDATMADAQARMMRARDEAMAHIGGTPVVRTVDEYGAPHFTYIAPGSAPPSQPSAGAPAYTPGGAKPTGKISIGDPAAKGP